MFDFLRSMMMLERYLKLLRTGETLFSTNSRPKVCFSMDNLKVMMWIDEATYFCFFLSRVLSKFCLEWPYNAFSWRSTITHHCVCLSRACMSISQNLWTHHHHKFLFEYENAVWGEWIILAVAKAVTGLFRVCAQEATACIMQDWPELTWNLL